MRIPATLAVLALLATAGCGSDDKPSGAPRPRRHAQGRISRQGGHQGLQVRPRRDRGQAGHKVSFTNEDTAKHTATSKPQGAFDSGDISKGQTKPVTFKKAGTFDYFCVYHPTMAGKVTVK